MEVHLLLTNSNLICTLLKHCLFKCLGGMLLMVVTTGAGWARSLLRSRKKTPSELKVYSLFIYNVLNNIFNRSNFFSYDG